MGVIAVEAGGDAPEAFEPAEAAFDAVALLVKLLVVGKLYQPIGFRRDDRFDVLPGQQRAQGVGIIAPVGDEGFGWLVFEQFRGAQTVGLLAACKQQAQRPPQSIAQQMDLGGQSTTGSPQRLVTRPLFPVAACWWALTRVESIIT